jgi:hypothetical protein
MKTRLFRNRKQTKTKINLPDPEKKFIIREGEEQKQINPFFPTRPGANRPLIRGIPDKPDIPPPPPSQTIMPD